MGSVLSIQLSCDTVFSHFVDCASRRISYINDLDDNLAALQIEIQKLVEMRNDLMIRVIYAEQHPRMRRKNQVQGWLTRAQAVEAEVSELIRDSPQEINKLCLGGFCSKNYKLSYKFGKRVAKLIQVVRALQEEGAFSEVFERLPEMTVDRRPSVPTVGLESTLAKVQRYLGEGQVGIVGIYGMGGVGKTTLLTKINNMFIEMPSDFNVVIWVTVSKDLQLEKIQDSIGKKLRLYNESWKNQSFEDKAINIFEALINKKFVLLLDDIWERVDLIKVGVPSLSAVNASNVIFTTRSLEICGLMEAQRKVEVECLAHEKALKLFQMKVGEDTMNIHPDIPELAEILAKECAGLPLALITIGRDMACKKSPEEWKHAIQILRRAASEFPGINKEVFPLLKFSYDSLPSDTVRSCFLYCCLFPENHLIIKEDLIDFWTSEGFFEDNEMSSPQDRGHYILGALIHARLLEEVEENNKYFVKMHDVIRDMALWITSEIEKDLKFLVCAGVGLIEAPHVTKWIDAKRISLMNNQIANLPVTPMSPDLLTLFLNDNRLKRIDNDFFEFMWNLKVLDLSYNHHLTTISPGVSNLVSLQHLDLSDSRIEKLPEELKTLVNLKYFNLERTHFLHTFPKQVISSFRSLRVLKIMDSVLCYFENYEEILKELLYLKHLSVLTITLEHQELLETLLMFHELHNNTLSLCLALENAEFVDLCYLAQMKHLKKLVFRYWQYVADIRKIQEINGFQSLCIVEISECYNFKELTWLALASNLKILRVEYCNSMTEIVSAEILNNAEDMLGSAKAFTKLEYLLTKPSDKPREYIPESIVLFSAEAN